ncbi:MAG TPA: hypothetical protein VKE74_23700, partial [Gemmataceae bacterium]|nr:hypothetical protein [Gemmataceae bacterium]
FVGLLAGLSGFILFGATLLLTLVQSNVRFWRRGNFEALRAAWGEEKVSWLLVTVGYLVLVIGGAAVTLSARRRSLVVYNVEPDRFEATLMEVFEHLGRPVERRGNLWSSGLPLCELDPFAGGKTVTLRWLSEDRHLFQEVERHLRDAVRTITTVENPAGRWLTSAAAGCIIVIAFCIVFIIGLAVLR